MTPEKTQILKVEIPDRALAQSILQRWSDGSGVSLRILRGRISQEEARFELEIRGSSADVARIVRQSVPWTASRRLPSKVSQGAPA